MAEFYTWSTVLVPDVNQPDMPRLILRGVPIVSSSSLPGSTARSPPGCGDLGCSSPSPSSASSSSSSCSTPKSPSPPKSPGPSSPPSPPRCSPSSPPSHPPPVPEKVRWTCVLHDDENKIILRRLKTASSPVTTQTPERPSTTSRPSRFQANTSSRLVSKGPEEKWVKNLRAILRERNKQRGSRGCKRAAEQPEGHPPAKRPVKN
ncbi:uncharacterized protein [Trachinotus anak]|uniref:uncharacterized protein n=1 Tax=Trachinotus anak TaxID=443729 RepID=UPI0039F1711A